MRFLTLAEIQGVRDRAHPERLRQCGVAFAVATTYFPVLCEMAETYVKARAMANAKGDRIYYSSENSSDGWVVVGSDGYRCVVGTESACKSLVERLNATIIL
jgi:mannose/fructose/N-acetylgalactosamine-specific phosphotransferase system component IIC